MRILNGRVRCILSLEEVYIVSCSFPERLKINHTLTKVIHNDIQLIKSLVVLLVVFLQFANSVDSILHLGLQRINIIPKCADGLLIVADNLSP